MTTFDIKALTEQVERDLRDKPIWRLLYTGVGLLALGLIVNMALGEADPEVTERWDGPAAVCAAIGGIFVAASWVVRILQRGRREEMTQEISRALAPIEVERARRDMKILDVIEPLTDMMRHHSICLEETAIAMGQVHVEVASAVKQSRAEDASAVNGFHGTGKPEKDGDQAVVDIEDIRMLKRIDGKLRERRARPDDEG